MVGKIIFSRMNMARIGRDKIGSPVTEPELIERLGEGDDCQLEGCVRLDDGLRGVLIVAGW